MAAVHSSMKYPSKYSNGKQVSAAQYITEIICEHYAKKNKLDLYYRFWTSKNWSQFYRNQIASANKLIKQHSEDSVIRALNSEEARNIYSLRAPHLSDIIEKHKRIISTENKTLKTNINRNTVGSGGRQSYKKKNILDKLEDIDNES